MSVTVKIDTKSKTAQKLLEYLKTLSYVKVEEENLYDPEFVKMVLESAASEKRIVVEDVDELWDNL